MPRYFLYSETLVKEKQYTFVNKNGDFRSLVPGQEHEIKIFLDKPTKMLIRCFQGDNVLSVFTQFKKYYSSVRLSVVVGDVFKIQSIIIFVCLHYCKTNAFAPSKLLLKPYNLILIVLRPQTLIQLFKNVLKSLECYSEKRKTI